MKDFNEILKLYILLHHMQLFIEKGQFPDKTTWKNIVKRTIHQYHTEEWRERTVSDSSLEYLEYFTVALPTSRSGNLALHLIIYHSLSSLPNCGPFHQHTEQKPVTMSNYVYLSIS